jgi:hypothetical protein
MVHLVWEKHYTNGTLPDHIKRGSFWWRDILKLLDTFKGLASVSLQNGRSCNMWTDLWGSLVPCQAFPELFSFAKRKSISVQKAKEIESLEQPFHLPLSTQDFQQLNDLLEALEQHANADEMLMIMMSQLTFLRLQLGRVGPGIGRARSPPSYPAQPTFLRFQLGWAGSGIGWARSPPSYPTPARFSAPSTRQPVGSRTVPERQDPRFLDDYFALASALSDPPPTTSTTQLVGSGTHSTGDRLELIPNSRVSSTNHRGSINKRYGFVGNYPRIKIDNYPRSSGFYARGLSATRRLPT